MSNYYSIKYSVADSILATSPIVYCFVVVFFQIEIVSCWYRRNNCIEFHDVLINLTDLKITDL